MKKIKYLYIVIIAIFLEVIVFNITSYRTLFGKYEVKTFVNPEVVNYEDNKVYLKISDINEKVVTLKLQLKNITDVTEYKVFYSDETSKEFRGLNSKNYISSSEKSKYVPLYLSGKTNAIIISIDKDIYDFGKFDKIVLNEKIPFEFNIVRFLVVLAILIFIYSIKHIKFFSEIYDRQNFKQELILIGIFTVFLFILSFINTYSDSEISTNNNSFLAFTTNEGIYNKDFVDALSKGKLHLLQDPSEKFLELENPYDALNRGEAQRDIDYKWDTAFFNGHQYIYFGVLPAITIFLPFFLLTHKYLKVSVVVFIFSILIFILLKEILLKLLNRYFKEISFKNVIYCLITLYSGSLIFYANGMSRVYELVIVSGLYCVLQGIYFILKSLENEKNRHLNIFLGTTFLALSVACRPTDLFVSLLIVPFLLKLFIEYVKNIKEKKFDLIKLIVSVLIPYLIVGIALMLYNYKRFGNVFDFGNKYQITVNNMMTLGSRIFSIPAGLVCNLFGIVNFIPDFPFITHSNDVLTFNGYYYIENMIGGIFMLAPICFCTFFINKSNRKIENKELKIIINTLLIIGIFIAVISIAMAGSNQRYLIDYAWMIVLCGILIFMSIYTFLKSKEAKRILQLVLCVTAIYTFIVSISAGIISEKDYMKNYSPEEYYKLKYTVCFWE